MLEASKRMRMTSGDLGQSGYISSPNLSTVSTDGSKDQFPVGMRVLVVDDDQTTLTILEAMLRRCRYNVTTCGKATTALALLREHKNDFDLVISDVYMPDMDGFKLLELVGLEMDLPVIMMSTDGDYNNVMKGITHGACDYLLKPVRMEELRNIWQHLVRKRKNEARETETLTPAEADKLKGGGGDDVEHLSSACSKKRKDVKEEDEGVDHDSEDPSSLKKPRVVWSVELHQQFVNAVNKLNIDKAVPKKILELMDVPGLTRENVASHLQKYRLYLKRISAQQPQNSAGFSFGGADGPVEGRGHGSFSLQAVPAVQQGVIGRIGTTNNLPASTALDQSGLLQLSGGGPVFRPNMTPPVFGSQNSYFPAFSGGYQIEQQAPQVPLYGLNPIQQQVPANASPKLPGMTNLGLTGTFCPNQNGSSNPLVVQLLQHQRQQQQQQPPIGIPGPGLGQQQRTVLSEINLGVNTGLNDEVGYTGLNAAVMRSSGAMENKNGGLLGVVESNFSPASLGGIPPLPPVAPAPMVSFDAAEVAAVKGLNPGAVVSSAGFGMPVYNQNRRPQEWAGTQEQQRLEACSPVMSPPSYNHSVGSHTNNYNAVAAGQDVHQQHKKLLEDEIIVNPGTVRSLRESSEKSTAESSFKPKVETISDSLISAKIGFQIDQQQQAPAADDLLSFYLKQQQQEDMSFVDNDLAFDGYVADNLYVK
ncbi:two-component response regulator ARR1 isoform X1 [Selaginella moellendorffii]|uniref:two-component response regulator ARR1 isoform X1 n=1 Tax=Selaginella moellendorffii TaxID=88036 RepID=UPI000D1CA5DA|nr:two-component response regulator ARR1 isoform X1 [Selaginella moellendorffii]|eukprot:XP_024534380.1 two-component response regulator ARR1 isoform X1 [Selaginella moellendorffii]